MKYFNKVIYNYTNNIFIFPIYNIYVFFYKRVQFVMCVINERSKNFLNI